MKKRLDELLRIALYYQASDIYFSVNQGNIRIEFKHKDKMITVKTIESDLNFFRYLQYCANLDLGNSLLPQTGRIETDVQGERISLRFSVIKSYQMTNGVLRILNGLHQYKLENLTIDKEIVNYLNQIENHRSGLYVFSGPTGSGKTTTLYSILEQVKNKKIYTLEDPIEVFSKNYVQLQINEKQDLDYAQGIKQLMRHAPDIIMIGEIRDEDAAKMAVRCALTGHLVLTSIHAGSSVGAIERLLELGVSKYQLKDVLLGVTNQRLYYSNKLQKKIGVYELLERKGINEYFEKGILPNYKTIPEKLKSYLKTGILSILETKQDMDE